MQPVEIRHHQEHLAPECLQTAPGVAGAIAQDCVAHAIGDAGLDFLEAGVLAPDALAGARPTRSPPFSIAKIKSAGTPGCFGRRRRAWPRWRRAARTPLRTRRLTRRRRVTDLAQISRCFMIAASRSAVASVEPSLT